METFFTVGSSLVAIGGLMVVIGNIWLLVLGFRHSIAWALAIFFLPFAALVFAAMYWDETQEAAMLSIGGTLVAGVALVLFFIIPAGSMAGA